MFNLPVDTLNFNIGCSVAEFLNLIEDGERRLYLYGEITSADEDQDEFFPTTSPVSALVRKIFQINLADKDIPIEERKPIILYINSPGGNLVEGFALVSAIELSKTPVYTVNVGEWCSMAFLIGIVGTKRYSLPYMTFLMHEASSISVGKISSMEDKIEFDRDFSRQVIKTCILRHSTMSDKDYDLVAKKELYMLPERAKDFGFIDEIVTDIDTIL
ncbi:ATP-dependent Clp protease proteolytic subunit [Candidatus Saccharibacteria bacterium]|nr:ATP-dependent Clp protease proteolytic subunit [Candidatus Saccharibacteria bacterium]